MRTSLRLDAAAALAAGTLALLAPGLARAHFVLSAPPSWAQLDTGGNPQKSAPCGQADPGVPAVATNTVTPFRPGETITVTVTETTPHPGWYRAVLAVNNRNELPMDPMVTPGTSQCGNTTADGGIVGLTPQNPPVFPVLVDGALYHTGTLTGPRSFTVTLPTNVTCPKCTLQIVEFMTNHGLNVPGGCYYHHCADISIMGTPVDGGATGSGGSAGGTDAGRDTRGAGGSSGAGGTAGAGAGGATGAGGAATTGTGGATGAGGTTTGGTGGTTGGGSGGTTGGQDAGATGSSESGCGCGVPGGQASWPAAFGLLAVLALRRRQR